MKTLLIILYLLVPIFTFSRSTDPNLDLRSRLKNEMSKSHKPLSYKDARKKLFGNIHLESDNQGSYFIKDIYCLKKFNDSDFPKGGSLGPDLIPEHTIMNTEHVWPKSRFSNNKIFLFENEYKISDLHILYPSDTQLNSARSNFKFGNVDKPINIFKCSKAKLGFLSGEIIFEPPSESRGNVARASFYFSIRYNRPIDEVEEKTLRKWADQDPVDEIETKRNNFIEKFQGNRNVFIDKPELINSIKDF